MLESIFSDSLVHGYVWLTYKIIVGSPPVFGFTFSCFHATNVIACLHVTINCFSDQNELGKHTVYCVVFITYFFFCISHLLMYYEDSEKMDSNMEVFRTLCSYNIISSSKCGEFVLKSVPYIFVTLCIKFYRIIF